MAQKKWGLIIASLALGGAVLGGVGAYLHFKLRPAINAKSPMSSAKIIPGDASFAGYLLTDTKAWSKIQQFGSPEAQTILNQTFDSITQQAEQRLLQPHNIDLEKDLLPWIGSVMLATLPSTPSGSSSSSNLLVVGIKDKIAALDFANKHKSQLQAQKTTYKGIDLMEVTDGGQTPHYLAILDDHLVLSDTKTSVERAIDTYKGESSLAKVMQQSSNISDTQVENQVAQFYIPRYPELIAQVTQDGLGTNNIPPQVLKQLDAVESIAVGVGITPIGVHLKSLAHLNPIHQTASKVAFKPISEKLIAHFPANTIALVTGGNIKQGWDNALEESKKDPSLTASLNAMRQKVLQATRLDLDRDILGWMNGDFALGLVPSTQGLLAQAGMGGALVITTSDRPTAEATVQKLDTLASQNGIQINQRQAGSVNITGWQFFGQSALSHGWVNNETLFMALGEDVSQSIATPPSKSLKESETFGAITRSLPQKNNGLFYADMDQIMTLIQTNSILAQSNLITPEAEAILSSMNGIGITSTPMGDANVQTEMLLKLKPKTTAQ